MRLLGEHHALDDAALLQAATHDLDDPDVVNVEVGGVLGEHRENSLGDQVGQELLVAVLLAGDDGPDGLAQFLLRPQVLNLIDPEFLERVEGNLLCALVARDDIGRLQPHA